MQRIKVLLYFAIVIAGALVLYKIFPPYMDNFTFKDELKTEVVRWHIADKTDEDIKAAVLKLAEQRNLPISEPQVHVQRRGKSLTVSVEYEVHVDLPGYPLDLEFSPSTTNTVP